MKFNKVVAIGALLGFFGADFLVGHYTTRTFIEVLFIGSVGLLEALLLGILSGFIDQSISIHKNLDKMKMEWDEKHLPSDLKSKGRLNKK